MILAHATLEEFIGGALDQDCERYSTYDQAEKGHAKIVAKVLAAAKGAAQ